ATVDNGTGSKQQFGALQRMGIDRKNILQVAAAENSIIHANPVDGDEYRIGGEPAHHGTPAPQLTFLYKDFARTLQEVCRGLRVMKTNLLFPDLRYLLRDLRALLLPFTGGYKYFVHNRGPPDQGHPEAVLAEL